jgi:hypothetical protein
MLQRQLEPLAKFFYWDGVIGIDIDGAGKPKDLVIRLLSMLKALNQLSRIIDRLHVGKEFTSPLMAWWQPANATPLLPSVVAENPPGESSLADHLQAQPHDVHSRSPQDWEDAKNHKWRKVSATVVELPESDLG